MNLTDVQGKNLGHALQESYLKRLFLDRVGQWGGTHCSCFLMAKALKSVIGGEMYTMSGKYLVTNMITDWHILVKKGGVFWDAEGRHTQEDLAESWCEDNLENLQFRPFEEKDLLTIALIKSYPHITESGCERFFDVLHGDQYEPFVQELTQYLESMKATNPETVDLCIWPCGTVCELSDVEEYTWKSDDYAIVSMPLGLDEEVFASSYLDSQATLASFQTISDRSDSAPDF